MGRTRYKVTLDGVDGTLSEGFVYHCCWPCVCDATDLVRVDTLTVPTKEGDGEGASRGGESSAFMDASEGEGGGGEEADARGGRAGEEGAG